MQTLERKAGRNGKRESTPKSMKPATVKDMSPKVTAEVDIPELVAIVATRKASIGQSFAGRRAGQSLYASVCSELKKRRGVDPITRLADAEATLIEAECVKFMTSLTQRAETEYPEVATVRLNVPVAKIDSKSHLVTDFTWQSRVTRCRLAQNLGDERVGLNELLRATKARLDRMLGYAKKGEAKKGQSKAYTREEIALVEGRVNAYEARIRKINSELAKLNRKGNGKGK